MYTKNLNCLIISQSQKLNCFNHKNFFKGMIPRRAAWIPKTNTIKRPWGGIK